MKITITEAIKQQEDALADKWCPWSPELKASIKLGIEALKDFKRYRGRVESGHYRILPGETEE